jgi:hypothetical protein
VNFEVDSRISIAIETSTEAEKFKHKTEQQTIQNKYVDESIRTVFYSMAKKPLTKIVRLADPLLYNPR